MCPDTSAGTLAIAAAPAPHFVCAVQSVLDRNSCHPDLCSPLRQLMWRYRATTYRLIQCSHQYKMVGMLECACAPTHLYARVSVGSPQAAHTRFTPAGGGATRHDTVPTLRTKTFSYAWSNLQMLRTVPHANPDLCSQLRPLMWRSIAPQPIRYSYSN